MNTLLMQLSSGANQLNYSVFNGTDWMLVRTLSMLDAKIFTFVNLFYRTSRTSKVGNLV